MTAVCHRMIAETAKELCAAEYEMNCGLSNDFYKAYPVQKKYVRRHWKNMIAAARKTLTACLKSPNLSENQKDQIMEALLLDRTLPQGDLQPTNQSGLIH